MVDIQILSQKVQVGFTIAVDRQGFTLTGEQTGVDLLDQRRQLKSATLWHAAPQTTVAPLPSVTGLKFSPPLMVTHGFQTAFGKGFANWLLDLLGAKLEIHAYKHAPHENVCITYTGVLFGYYRWHRVDRACSVDFIPDDLRVDDDDAGYEADTDRAVPPAVGPVPDAVIETSRGQAQVAGLEGYTITADDADSINATFNIDPSTRDLTIAQVKRFPQPVTSAQLERLIFWISGNLGNNAASNRCAANAVTAVLQLHEAKLFNESAAAAGLVLYVPFFNLHDALAAVLETYARVVAGRALPVATAYKLIEKIKASHDSDVQEYIKPFVGSLPSDDYLAHLA